MKKTIPVNFERGLMFFFLCMFSIGIFAQEISVTGLVTDTKNEPLIGVTIKVVGDDMKGTVTDYDGKYILTNVPSNAKIEVSYVGMQKQVIDVRGRSTINVTLSEDAELLDELVVVAYGVQKKVSVTGAISSVNTKDLRTSTSPSIANALSGRIAGLSSMQRVGGQPGRDDATMYLRGAGTVNGVNPLILIDGVPRDNIRTIDINEVESISVLKDASATALFGVRGANGVLIITTKRGEKGKPELSVNLTQSFSKLTREPDILGSVEYMNLRNEALMNDGKTPEFTPSVIEKYQNPLMGLDPNDPDYESKTALRQWMYPNNNWYEMIIKRWSPQTNANANISGGTDNISYFVNVGYLHQGGNMKTLSKDILNYDPSFKLDRYTFRSNIDYKVNKWLKTYLNFGTYIEKQNQPNPAGLYNGDSNWMVRDMFYMAQAILPISAGPLTLPGYGIPANKPLEPTYLNSGRYADRSPYYAMNFRGYNLNTRSNLNSSFGVDLDMGFITQGLSLKSMVSFDSYGNKAEYGHTNQSTYSVATNPETDEITFAVQELKQDNFWLTWGNSSRYNFNVQGQLLYNRTFGDHTVGAMIRGERDYWDSGEADIPFNVLGFAGRATYDYKSRYFAEVNFGYNGSEQFSPEKRFGFFPSISGGWAITNEDFLQDHPVLTFLKLRGSYGKVGNDKMGNVRFLYLDNITMGGGFSGSLANGQGVNEGLLGNKMLTWETAAKYNFGIDFSILKDFTGQFELFREDRSEILISRQSIPSWQGTPLGNIPKVNMGEMLNSGYEIELGYNKQINNDWFISVKGQLSYNKNELKNYDEVPRGEEYAYKYRSTGYPLNQNWGYEIDWDQDRGYWTEEALADPERVTYGFGTPGLGDFVYKDLNGDGVVDDKDQAPIGVGNIPRYSYGASISAQWKGFDAYIFFQGLAKFNSTFPTQGVYETTVRGTYFSYHKKAWTQERWENGEEITYPALTTSQGVSHRANSFFVFDRDFLRLKNLEFGYTLPANTLKFLGISSLRLYVSGQNVFTWSPKFRPTHLDPENDDSIGYPQTSMFSFGTNIKF